MGRDAVEKFFTEFEERFRRLVRETVAEELEPATGARAVTASADLVNEETRRQVGEQLLLSN